MGMELELSIFFEPRGALEHYHEACDSFLGASFFKLICSFEQAGQIIGESTDAASLNIFRTRRIRPPNVYMCKVPRALDIEEPFRLALSSVELKAPISLSFCPVRDFNRSREKEGVVACAGPVYDWTADQSQMAEDWVRYHRELGVQGFFYTIWTVRRPRCPNRCERLLI